LRRSQAIFSLGEQKRGEVPKQQKQTKPKKERKKKKKKRGGSEAFLHIHISLFREKGKWKASTRPPESPRRNGKDLPLIFDFLTPQAGTKKEKKRGAGIAKGKKERQKNYLSFATPNRVGGRKKKTGPKVKQGV